MHLNLTLPFALFLSLPAMAQWTPLATGMSSNRSLCELNGDLYCASYTTGVKKSVNGTGPFVTMNNGLPSTGGIFYVQSVGSDGTYVFAGTESGIYRSADGGANWTNANGSLSASPSVYANKFFSFDGTILAVFAGSVGQGGGIWRSGNGGDTWLVGHSGMGSNVVVNHITRVGTTLWASTSVGIYTSIDNAQNWTADPTVNYATYSLASVNNTLVIACTYGMRYSTNGGTIWLDATGDPSAPTEGELTAFDGMLYTLLPSPDGCLRSTNNGQTWAPYNDGFGVVDASAQEEFLVAGNMLYCTALFDVYSIVSTGNAVNDVPSTTAAVLPTVFEDGFFVRDNTQDGTLMLLDAAGRTVRTVRLSAASTQWIDRAGLASGTYRAILRNGPSGHTIPLGTLIAR